MWVCHQKNFEHVQPSSVATAAGTAAVAKFAKSPQPQAPASQPRWDAEVKAYDIVGSALPPQLKVAPCMFLIRHDKE